MNRLGCESSCAHFFFLLAYSVAVLSAVETDVIKIFFFNDKKRLAPVMRPFVSDLQSPDYVNDERHWLKLRQKIYIGFLRKSLPKKKLFSFRFEDHESKLSALRSKKTTSAAWDRTDWIDDVSFFIMCLFSYSSSRRASGQSVPVEWVIRRV